MPLDDDRPQKGPAPAFDREHPNLLGYGNAVAMSLRITEKRTGKTLREHVFAIPAEKYQTNFQARTALHYTADGMHLDMPEGDARGKRTWVISGSFGVWPRPREIDPATGKYKPAPDGMAALNDLAQLIDAYLQPEVEGRSRDEVQLELINPDAPADENDRAGDSHYVVVPEGNPLDQQRAGRRSGLRPFTLRLSGYARLRGDKRAQARRAAKDRSFLDKVLGTIDTIARDASFEQAFFRYRQFIAPVTQAVARLGTIRRFLERWASGIEEFIAFNLNLLESTVTDIRLLSVDLDQTLGVRATEQGSTDAEVARGIDRMGRDLQRMSNALRANPAASTSPLNRGGAGVVGPRAGALAIQSPLQAANDRARRALADIDAGRALSGSQGEPLATQTVIVGAGDTLDRLVPPGFTTIDVVRLNDLRYPYVDGSRTRPAGDPKPANAGGQWVAYLGDEIRVPARRGRPSITARGESPGASRTIAPRESEEDRVFGRDLLIDPDRRELVFDRTTGDLRTVGGVANLEQSLRTLCRLPLGTLPHAPDLGSYVRQEALGHWGGALRSRLIAIAAHRTITQDPRIRDVTSIEVAVEDGRVDIQLEAEAIDGTPLGRLALSA